MKRFLIPIAVLLVIVFVITGCSASTPTPTTTAPVTTLPATKTSAPATTTTAAPVPTKVQPVYGGVFEIITAAGPQALSYIPDMGPADSSAVFPAVERLLDINDGGKGLVGVLAENWKEDPTNLTITFNIRKGIKFSDGSDLNAEVVKWNFQLLVDVKRLQLQNALKSMEVTDPYTLVSPGLKIPITGRAVCPTWMGSMSALSPIPLLPVAFWKPNRLTSGALPTQSVYRL